LVVGGPIHKISLKMLAKYLGKLNHATKQYQGKKQRTMNERQKWNAKKKGYLKIHVAIYIKKVRKLFH
jgi:hypothetical protein